MKWFLNLKIAVKLIIAFVIVAIIAGIVGIVGVINIKSIEKNDTKLYEKITVPLGDLVTITNATQRARGNLRDILLSNTNEEYADYENRIKLRDAEVDAALVTFEETMLTEAGHKATDEFRAARLEFEKYEKKIISLKKANKLQEAVILLKGDGDVSVQKMQEKLKALTDIKVKLAKETADGNKTQSTNAVLIMIIIIIIGMVIAVGLGIFISLIISRPIKQLVVVADKISEGDLRVNVEVNSKDEVGNLALSFDKMLTYLKLQAQNVEKIAYGDFTVEIDTKSENDLLSKNMINMTEMLKILLVDTNTLIKASIEGKLNLRGNAEKFKGGYKEIIQGINRMLDTLVGHIDNMPAPVMIIDTEYNIQYMNKIGAEILGTSQKQLIGNKCYDNFKTSDCNSANCACAISMQQEQKVSRETDAHPRGMNVDILYTAIPMKDEKDKVIGALELIVDQSVIKKAARIAKKQADYQDNEILKLLGDIQNLSEGKLQSNSNIADTDEDTKGIGETFTKINNTFKESIKTLALYVKEISETLNQMSGGNLDVGITGDYKGDFIEIKNSLNQIIVSFNDVLGDINSAAEQVAAGARQVSSSGQALSQGSTEQASSIEEITSSMTEVAAQTKRNAVNANQANELAISAKENAAQGNIQMQEMVKAMAEINDSSSNISKIIKVIDEIAFQTNILALNAAVEAARAGQHGKGFAVVAEEVRNLAARSANAAKETTVMIEGSIKKVEVGTKIANETAIALNDIVEGVAKAAAIVANIASASNEQATGISQINQAIEQVAQVVQTNSATAEESASASEELSSQAELLKEGVRKFKLKKNSVLSHNNSDAISPEVLRVIESMINRKNNINGASKDILPISLKPSKSKISLDDYDYGKY